jgi:enamine deaminase RidA (YjgF/YER057c/UK114 family)
VEEFLSLNNQRGIDPVTNLLIEDRRERVRQIFRNMASSAEESGSNLGKTIRLIVMVADMKRDRPLINDVQKEIWGKDGPFPCRTIIQVDYLGDDFVEMDSVILIATKSSNPIEFIAPKKSFSPTGTWSLGIKTDSYIFVSGMRGINPETETLVVGEAPRVRQAFRNMKIIAEAGGGKITNAIGLVIYATDEKYIEIIEMLQKSFWLEKPLPPIKINIVTALNDNDIVEIEGTFKYI